MSPSDFVTKKKNYNGRKNLWHNLTAYLVEFCQGTTLHGFNHIVNPNLHLTEKLFWISVVIAAMAFAANIIHTNYSRFQNDPVLTSMDRNFRKWNITFPGTTACLVNKLNWREAGQVIKRKWNVENGTNFDKYMDFLRVLSNSSYRNLKDFQRFSDDPELNSENLGELMKQTNRHFGPGVIEIFNYDRKQIAFHEVLTELGICYSYDSFLGLYLKPGRKSNEQFPVPESLLRMFNCTYDTSKCSGLIASFGSPVKHYIHSPYELPDLDSPYWFSQERFTATTHFNALKIISDPSLENLKVSQRKCHFREENEHPEYPYYSYRLCKMNCRRKLAMELCKCVPHFYVERDDQPHCDIKGLVCLSNHTEYIMKLKESSKNKTYPCTCYQSCSETEYFVSKYSITRINWYQRSEEYIWEMDEYPKMMLKRKVLFGFNDLLVSFGGTAGLFLGCSLMSGIEIIYFFTFKIIRYFYRIYRNDQKEKVIDIALVMGNQKRRKSSLLVFEYCD